MPLKVEYSLTEYGQTLEQLMKPTKEWDEGFLPRLAKIQKSTRKKK